MKWFQVDADTPNDPKFRAVFRALGTEGVGGLFLLWCFIADHGTLRPGWSIDSARRPIPVDDLREASKLDESKFDALVHLCVESGHFDKRQWVAKKVIAIPAMEKRADAYTQRKQSGGHLRLKYGKSGMTRLEIFERDDFRCEYCGHKFNVDRLEVDHRIPVFRGGTDDPSNLTTACKSCNRKKGHDILDKNGKKIPSTLLVESTADRSTHDIYNTRQDLTEQLPPVAPQGGRVTRAERKLAEQIRKNQFGCRHEPRCENAETCITAIVHKLRAKAVAS